MRASLDTATEEKEFLTDKHSRIGTQLQEKDQECDRLKVDVKTLEDKVDDYQNKLATIESQVSNEKSSFDDERTKLTNQVKERDEECTKLKGEVSGLQQKVEGYEAKLNVLDSVTNEKSAGEEERLKLANQIEERVRENAKLQGDVEGLRKEVENYQSQLSLAQESSAKGQDSVGAVQAEL